MTFSRSHRTAAHGRSERVAAYRFNSAARSRYTRREDSGWLVLSSAIMARRNVRQVERAGI